MTLQLDQRRRDQILSSLTLIIVATMAVSAILIIGFRSEDLRNNIALALIVTAVLADLGIATSWGSRQTVRHVAGFSWVLIGVACLGFSVYLVLEGGTEARKGAETVLLITMFVLAFPASCLAMLVVIAYSTTFLGARQMATSELIAFWLLFAGTGYAQWFVVASAVVARKRQAVSRSG